MLPARSSTEDMQQVGLRLVAECRQRLAAAAQVEGAMPTDAAAEQAQQQHQEQQTAARPSNMRECSLSSTSSPSIPSTSLLPPQRVQASFYLHPVAVARRRMPPPLPALQQQHGRQPGDAQVPPSAAPTTAAQPTPVLLRIGLPRRLMAEAAELASAAGIRVVIQCRGRLVYDHTWLDLEVLQCIGELLVELHTEQLSPPVALVNVLLVTTSTSIAGHTATAATAGPGLSTDAGVPDSSNAQHAARMLLLAHLPLLVVNAACTQELQRLFVHMQQATGDRGVAFTQHFTPLALDIALALGGMVDTAAAGLHSSYQQQPPNIVREGLLLFLAGQQCPHCMQMLLESRSPLELLRVATGTPSMAGPLHVQPSMQPPAAQLPHASLHSGQQQEEGERHQQEMQRRHQHVQQQQLQPRMQQQQQHWRQLCPPALVIGSRLDAAASPDSSNVLLSLLPSSPAAAQHGSAGAVQRGFELTPPAFARCRQQRQQLPPPASALLAKQRKPHRLQQQLQSPLGGEGASSSNAVQIYSAQEQPQAQQPQPDLTVRATMRLSMSHAVFGFEDAELEQQYQSFKAQHLYGLDWVLAAVKLVKDVLALQKSNAIVAQEQDPAAPIGMMRLLLVAGYLPLFLLLCFKRSRRCREPVLIASFYASALVVLAYLAVTPTRQYISESAQKLFERPVAVALWVCVALPALLQLTPRSHLLALPAVAAQWLPAVWYLLQDAPLLVVLLLLGCEAVALSITIMMEWRQRGAFMRMLHQQQRHASRVCKGH